MLLGHFLNTMNQVRLSFLSFLPLNTPVMMTCTEHPQHDAAQSTLNHFRGRATAEDLVSHLETLRTSLESHEDLGINVDTVVRSIAIQSLLHIGSRSFSHLLNAIERYLPLLRAISSGEVGRSWNQNRDQARPRAANGARTRASAICPGILGASDRSP